MRALIAAHSCFPEGRGPEATNAAGSSLAYMSIGTQEKIRGMIDQSQTDSILKTRIMGALMVLLIRWH